MIMWGYRVFQPYLSISLRFHKLKCDMVVLYDLSGYVYFNSYTGGSGLIVRNVHF